MQSELCGTTTVVGGKKKTMRDVNRRANGQTESKIISEGGGISPRYAAIRS